MHVCELNLNAGFSSTKFRIYKQAEDQFLLLIVEENIASAIQGFFLLFRLLQ